MKNNKKLITCAQARETDIVNYLANKGIHPVKIKGSNYWYFSPLRQEKTASFKVDRKFNRWYDFGMGEGGNLIDLAILYSNCTIAEFLQSLKGIFSFDKPGFDKASSISNNTDGTIKILSSNPLYSLALLQYLKSRKIPLLIAEKYCYEISFRLYDKTYFSIGFKNDSGGYEMRHQWCKNSSSPKGITRIKNGFEKVAVFEGFFDFLSFLFLMQSKRTSAWDFCILNSLSFFEKAQPSLEGYQSIHLFLDNDDAGKKCSAAALKTGVKYIDESGLYQNYKDLNEWIVIMGKEPKSNITRYPP